MIETEPAAGAIAVSVEGHLGIIALDRPAAINALTRDMVNAVRRQLDAWRQDPAVRAVLFEGRGERGFCAGGDVRAVRQFAIDGQADEAVAFFRDEYAMNAAIAGYPKPVAVIAHGVVMGGGIGIAGHARFRFATPGVHFAMPEGAIGFVADVGVNAILALAPRPRALLFLLTGIAVDAADAVALGLTDCIVPDAQVAAVRQGIVAAAAAGDVETSLVSLMQSAGIEPGERVLCAAADALSGALDEPRIDATVAAVAGAAEADPRFAIYRDALARLCPASLAATHASHLAARHQASLDRVLATDLALADMMCRRSDFAEGVRAVLVDRDGRPNWQPERLEAVDQAAIARIIAGAAT